MADELVRLLVDFGAALRAAGLAVGTGDVLTFGAALATVDPTDLVDLYWAGRTTLVNRREDIATYDAVFRRFFLDETQPVRELLRLKASHDGVDATFDVPATEAGPERTEDAPLGLLASTVDILRHKAFAECTAEELAALRRIMAGLRLSPPRRRTRRTAPARSGTLPDLRRTVRASLRTSGEPIDRYWRDRRVRPRPLVLILDVSGSMAGYSRALLQFAYSAGRAVDRVEVFCFGTRLTRITRQLRTRSPDLAMRQAAAEVLDWDGGTRIGDSLDAFVRGWCRRGIGRGAIVAVCSDGLDRGDPEVLATALDRLTRLCHRLVWLTPHHADSAGGQHRSLGMAVAEPYLDAVLPCGDLHALERLGILLTDLG